MSKKYTSTVNREKVFFNENKLERKKYDNILFHANKGKSMQRLKDETRKILQAGYGKDVLEIGAHAWTNHINTMEFPPNSLTCINISEKELDRGIKARNKKKLDFVHFIQMDANSLEFKKSSFDLIFGIAILHHLNFSKAVSEIHRVLKSDGQAVFIEPLGTNPVAKLVRKLTPKARTIDEQPLGNKEIKLLKRYFYTEISYFQLLSIPAAIISNVIYKNPSNPFLNFFDNIDIFIEKRIPFSRMLFRTVLIHCKKMD